MIIYLLKVLLCSALLLAAYKLLLEKEKMHRFNRYYLLCSLLLPFFLPLIRSSAYKPAVVSVTGIVDNILLQQPFQNPVLSDTVISKPEYFSAVVSVIFIYIAVAIFLLFRYAALIRILYLKTRRVLKQKYDHSWLVPVQEKTSPYSFLNYIFINGDDLSAGKVDERILLHESAHTRQRHSWDLLLVSILQAVTWFNPFLFFYRKCIQLNHEFLADEAVLREDNNINSYGLLLIDTLTPPYHSVLTSSFNFLTTKKRLIMMTRTKSARRAFIKTVALLPVLGLSVLLVASRAEAQENVPRVNPPRQQIASSPTGALQELMDEYASIVSRIRNDKSRMKYRDISDADRSRLETIFLSMSKEQQDKQVIFFTAPFPPMEKAVPGEGQFEKLKNASVYGVWVDGKKVNNSVLNNYSNTDFAHLFVSKLYGAAKKGRSYSYQADLMTTAYYENYRKEALANKRNYLSVRTFAPGK